jgi:ribosomal protein S27AE
MELRLINLDCPRCGSALTAGAQDILFLCAHCGSGAVLDDNGLRIVESTALLPAPGRRARIWRPGWLIEADVTVHDRIRFKNTPTPGWAGRKTFVIPAFSLPLAECTRLADALTAAAGALTEVPREPVTGGTMPLDDAVEFCRYLVVGGEVRQRDMLASVGVQVSPVGHRLVALPFDVDGDHLSCAISGTGLTVRAR